MCCTTLLKWRARVCGRADWMIESAWRGFWLFACIAVAFLFFAMFWGKILLMNVRSEMEFDVAD